MANDLVITTPAGLYCPRADIYIDPLKPVPQALITHAHSDHARPGVGQYITHALTAKLLKLRIGRNISTDALEYGEHRELSGVRITLYPAAHVPGSAQILLEGSDQRWLISGDYKREADGFTEPFRQVECTHFVTESTFGLPIYRWQSQQTIVGDILDWWRQNASLGYRSVLGAYSLGKAQRIIAALSHHSSSFPGPLFVHQQIHATNQVLREHDESLARLLSHALPLPQMLSTVERSALVIAPPQILNSSWIDSLSPGKTAVASGWMAVRGIRRRSTHDAGFVLSDHADFPALISTIKQSGASKVLVTHGYTEQLSRYLREREHIQALPLSEIAALRAEFVGEAQHD